MLYKWGEGGEGEQLSDVQKVMKYLWYSLVYRNAGFHLPGGLTSAKRNYQTTAPTNAVLGNVQFRFWYQTFSAKKTYTLATV